MKDFEASTSTIPTANKFDILNATAEEENIHLDQLPPPPPTRQPIRILSRDSSSPIRTREREGPKEAFDSTKKKGSNGCTFGATWREDRAN